MIDSRGLYQLTLIIGANVVAILLGWEIVPVAFAAGVAEQFTATHMFVKVHANYVAVTPAFFHRLAADPWKPNTFTPLNT